MQALIYVSAYFEESLAWSLAFMSVRNIFGLFCSGKENNRISKKKQSHNESDDSRPFKMSPKKPSE